MNKRIKAINKKIEGLKRDIARASNELKEAHKERFLTCSRCHIRSKVRNCNVIDHKSWYCNTGSPNGGFYTHDYYAWECPHCGCYSSHEIEKDLFYETFQSFKDEQVRN